MDRYITANSLSAIRFRIAECKCFEHVLEREIVDFDAFGEAIIDYESYCQGSMTLEGDGLQIVFYWVGIGGRETYMRAHRFDIKINADMEIALVGGKLIHDDDEEMDYVDSYNVIREIINEKVDWKARAAQETPKPKLLPIDGLAEATV